MSKNSHWIVWSRQGEDMKENVFAHKGWVSVQSYLWPSCLTNTNQAQLCFLIAVRPAAGWADVVFYSLIMGKKQKILYRCMYVVIYFNIYIFINTRAVGWDEEGEWFFKIRVQIWLKDLKHSKEHCVWHWAKGKLYILSLFTTILIQGHLPPLFFTSSFSSKNNSLPGILTFFFFFFESKWVLW